MLHVSIFFVSQPYLLIKNIITQTHYLVNWFNIYTTQKVFLVKKNASAKKWRHKNIKFFFVYFLFCFQIFFIRHNKIYQIFLCLCVFYITVIRFFDKIEFCYVGAWRYCDRYCVCNTDSFLHKIF